MRGLPKDFNGEFLVKRTLEMICFNANQIYFHFDTDVTIIVESEFSYQRTQVAPVMQIQVPVQQSNLMELLEHTVSQVSGNEEGTLTLFFVNGQILKFYNTPQYESYKIKRGNEVIII